MKKTKQNNGINLKHGKTSNVLVDKVLAHKVYNIPFVKEALKVPSIAKVDVIVSLLQVGLNHPKLLKKELEICGYGKHNANIDKRIAALEVAKTELKKQKVNVKGS